MLRKIKFGVIGLGHIGTKHVDAIIKNPHSELTAVADKLLFKDLEKKRNQDLSFLKKYKFYNNLNDIFQDPNIDVLNICTPNGLHYEMAKKSITNGKHILIEKPMTLNSKHAYSLVEHAKKNNKFVFCVMQNRFSPTIMWLKKIIDQRRLGKVFSVHVNCFWNRNKNYYESSDWHGKLDLDGGPLFTQFSHFIDILYWLFGEFVNINAQFNKFRKSEYIDFEDSGILSFDFSSGPKGTLNYSTSIWEKNFESSIIVTAEKGTVKIGGQYMDELQYCHIENYKQPTFETGVSCNDYGTYQGSAANHGKVIENIINVILHNGKIATSGEEGAKIVEIIEKIYSFRKKLKK